MLFLASPIERRIHMRPAFFWKTLGPSWWNRPTPAYVKATASRAHLWLLSGVLGVMSFGAGASPRVELVSAADPSLPKSVSAAGDSVAVGVTPDGAFVLFASLANNLVTNGPSGMFADLYVWNRGRGAVSLVSVGEGGLGGGNGNSAYGNMTPDGRYVVFASDASNLVANDTNQTTDVFVRDLTAGTTQLVSVNQQGTGSGNGNSVGPVITPDGRYVAFVSAAEDLVAGDANGIPDVFVRDLQTGVTSLVSQGAQSANVEVSGAPDSIAITPDGRFVAFSSTASGLVAGLPGVSQEVYVRDRVQDRTFWTSQHGAGQFLPLSYSPILSTDGRFVAFKTYTPGLVAASSFSVVRCEVATGVLDVISTHASGLTPDLADDYGPVMTPDGRFVAFAGALTNNGPTRVWVWDGQTQVASVVSVDMAGEAGGSWISDTPAMTPDGRYVVFLSNGTNLVATPVAGGFQVYLRDRQLGVTTLVTADAAGAGTGAAESAVPRLSADGRFVLFDSRGDVFVPGDLNRGYDVFVRDMEVPATELVSHAAPGVAAVTGNASSVLGAQPVSADGRYVVFESSASDLVPGDTNGLRDVFLRDLQRGSNALVSVNRFGSGGGNAGSSGSAMSANGRYVVFVSAADDLVENDTNRAEDVFVRDLLAGTTRLVSVNTDGGSGDRASTSPSISADGHWVAFQSQAANLVPIRPTGGLGYYNVYVRDLVTGMTMSVSTNGYSYPVIPPLLSPDGRFVAFQGPNPANLLVRNLQTGSTMAIGVTFTIKAFSGDSRVLAAASAGTAGTPGQFVLVDLIHGTNTPLVLNSGGLFGTQDLCVSQDGRWLAFCAHDPTIGSGANTQVFIYDVLNANLTLASAARPRDGSGEGGNGKSNSPRLSADGRFVAFRSAASNLVEGDYNDTDDVFSFDRLTGQTTLLSRGADGLFSASGMSLSPAMTPDASRVVFISAASDLILGDVNNTLDVFAVKLDPSIAIHDRTPVQLTVTGPQEGRVTVRWNATPGRFYRVEYTDSLVAPGWQDLSGLVTIAGASAWLSEQTEPNLAPRFYRVRWAE